MQYTVKSVHTIHRGVRRLNLLKKSVVHLASCPLATRATSIIYTEHAQAITPGTAYQQVNERLVAAAFRGTSCRESLGSEGIGPLAIRCAYDWEPDRVEALVRAHIRLGAHPAKWKTSRGVTIPKPGKDDYGLANAYRAISLLNCLGKTVEKVATMLVRAHCEATQGFHPGQYGCRAGRSVVDAVGVAIA